MPRQRVAGSSGACRPRLSGVTGMALAGLAGIIGLTFCSCQGNVSDYPATSGSAPPSITSASGGTRQTPVAPSEPTASLPDSQPAHGGGGVASVQAAPDDTAKPVDSTLGAAAKSAQVNAGVAPAKPTCPDQPRGEQAEIQTTAAANAETKYPLQDNPLAGCPLCHVDIEDQFVGGIHFQQKVGCRTCHGPSEGHIADENNEVKPDELFARENVDRLCGRCHECSRSVPEEPELTQDGQVKVCIDCHGPHDLVLTKQHSSRTVRDEG